MLYVIKPNIDLEVITLGGDIVQPSDPRGGYWLRDLERSVNHENNCGLVDSLANEETTSPRQKQRCDHIDA